MKRIYQDLRDKDNKFNADIKKFLIFMLMSVFLCLGNTNQGFAGGTIPPCPVPNDPDYTAKDDWNANLGRQWGLQKISAEKAWCTSTGKGTIVAVIDTGVYIDHPDLVNNVWVNEDEIPGDGLDNDQNGYVDDRHGWDFINNTPNLSDPVSHGTMVAGLIAAVGHNGQGMIGLAYDAKIMPLRAFVSDGRWDFQLAIGNHRRGHDGALAKAVRYAADNGAKVINLSFQPDTFGISDSEPLKEAILYAYQKGCVIVTSGFMPDQRISYAIINVGASDEGDQVYKNPFASEGRPDNRRDVVAPGAGKTRTTMLNIYSLLSPGSEYEEEGAFPGEPLTVGCCNVRYRGSSLASAYVSGLAALILSANPGIAPEQVRQIIRKSADDIDAAGFDLYAGYGRINASRALQMGPVAVARIHSPFVNQVVRPQQQLAIPGSAYGEKFDHYSLEYTADLNSGTWNTIVSHSTTPVNSGVLGTWTTPSPGSYYLKLTVVDKLGSVYDDIVGPLYVDAKIRLGFPRVLSPDMPDNYLRRFAIGDVDKDGKKEIVVATPSGIVYVLKEDGTNLPNWPKDMGAPITSNLVLVDIDRNGDLEIFFGINSRNEIWGLHHDGTPVAKWPQMITETTYDFCSLAAEDVDADGGVEIMVYPNSPQSYQLEWMRSHLYIFNADGTLQSKTQVPFLYVSRTGQKIDHIAHVGLAVGDIDGDGKKEIAFPFGHLVPRDSTEVGDFYYYMLVVKANGEILNTLKLTSPKISGPSFSQMAPTNTMMGDVDGDGDLEIVTKIDYRREDGSHIFIIYYDKGTLRSESFPAGLKYASLIQSLADLDDNGDAEILSVFKESDTSYKIKAYHHDGTVALQQDAPMSVLNMVVGNIDGDLPQEIILGGYTSSGQQKFYVLDHTGSFLEGYNPFILPVSVTGSLAHALSDINKDGVVDLVSMTDSGFLSVYTINGSRDNNSLDWPMYQNAPYRNGLYLDPKKMFIRGDSDDNGFVDRNDANFTLQYLFEDSTLRLACPDAADANDDGRVDISDPIMTFGHLFQGLQTLAQPHLFPGLDPTDDRLTCREGNDSEVIVNKEVNQVQCDALRQISEDLAEIDVCQKFIRGDANGDGKVDIADSQFIPAWLFKGGPKPPCVKAADADDNGKVDISDGPHINSFLFLGGSPIPPPYPGPGLDPTPDDLSCEVYPRPQMPWQVGQNGTLYTNQAWNYTTGYHFTPLKNGRIIGLGGYFNGTKTVFLWNSSTGEFLTQAEVTSANNWNYTNIKSVFVKAGTTYTVAVYLGGSGGSYRSGIKTLPQTYGNITIKASTSKSGNGRPTNNVTSTMYGQTDIIFVPDL